MITDPLFQGVLFGSLIALGIGIEHMRIRYSIHRKKQIRRQSIGVNYRKDPEPVWGNWTADIGRGLRR